MTGHGLPINPAVSDADPAGAALAVFLLSGLLEEPWGKRCVGQTQKQPKTNWSSAAPDSGYVSIRRCFEYNNNVLILTQLGCWCHLSIG
jgi:hypothetical protein